MDVLLLVLVAVLAVAVIAEFLLLLGLAREVGRIQVRLGPLGARQTGSGPVVGEPAPVVTGLEDQYARPVSIGEPTPGRDTLLMFVGPNCPTCHELTPSLRVMAKAEAADLRIVLVSDGPDLEAHERFRHDTGVDEHLPYVISETTGLKYQAGITPYGVLIDEDGIVRAEGLCNHMQHVESLLNARRLGISSLSEVSSVASIREAEQAAAQAERAAKAKARSNGEDA